MNTKIPCWPNFFYVISPPAPREVSRYQITHETSSGNFMKLPEKVSSETVLLADFMPKTTYFWHPVSVKLWQFFEFHSSFSETAVKLRTVSREFSKCRCTSVKMLKNWFLGCTNLRFFAIWKWKLCFFFSVCVKNAHNWKKKKSCGFTLFETQKKVFLQVGKYTSVNHPFFFAKSARFLPKV